MIAQAQVCAAQNDDSLPSCVPSPTCDNLDSVLRTSLWPHDPKFLQLACRRFAWWDSERVRSWFLEKGYTLYLRYSYTDSGYATGMYPVDTELRESVFPHANHEGPKPDAGWILPTLYGNTSSRGNIAYAQDTQGRHVAFKAILDGSEEFRILKYLHDQGVPRTMNDFHHVIPVLDFLPCEGHWVAVMPRWGIDPLLPECNKLDEVFHFIHCLLKGLTYLHNHRIAHGDIKTDNILVNHVHMDNFDVHSKHRKILRFQGKLTYAFYDFDGSTMFPPSMSLDECRLPSHVSYNTHYNQVPGDTLQAELDFNPFAFDVGMLGVMFCQEFQHMTHTVPMLAPLFDRMTTRDIARRFKASEALQFFEEQVIPLTSKEVMSLRASSPPSRYVPYDYYDRWMDLDPEFVEKWAAYREPLVPYHIHFLREICLYPWVFHAVTYIRRFARFLRRGWTSLTGILPRK